MTSHLLRQLTDLLQYTAFSEDGSLGRLAGVVFDPASWTIDHVLVAAPAASRALRVPARFFRSIDDRRRELHFSAGDGMLLSAGGHGTGDVGGRALFDAAALPGRTLYGCDGPAGTIRDVLVNIDAWQLRYLVVAAGTNRVLTDVEWCSSFGGTTGRVALDLPVAAVAAAPPYPGLEELSSGYEETLYRHYTSRKYATYGGMTS